MTVQNVKLVPLPTTAKPWNVIYGNQSGDTPQTYPKVEAVEGSGPHLIVFNILPGSSPNAKFANSNPMSVKAGGKPGPSDSNPQIVAVRSDDGKQLFVLNKNDKEEELHYVLNFDGTHANLDPIIDNGGRTFSFMSVEVLIAAAVFLTVGFLVRPLIMKMFGS